MAFTWRAIAEMQRMIAEHPSYNKYHIPHQEPKLFRDWNEFIDFCQDRGYMMGTKEVSRRQVEGLVESGDLLLCKPEVLDADCVGRWPKYWLLERKAR